MKFCVVCINSRSYVCCSECYVVSNECDERTVVYFGSFFFRGERLHPVPPNGYSLRVVGVPQSRGTEQIVSTLSCLSGGPGPQFFGSQSCDPAAWLALLAGDIEPNPGPKPTLKTLLHKLTQSPTLAKYINSPVQSSPPSLSPAHSPPNSLTSVYHSRTEPI